MKNKKGFVVSAVLYPLLVLFLAIIMGLLSMTDTRKRILDKMKLEITDNIFDDAACSCDTILAKLNYIIANGTGGSGGDTGSYAYNKLTLNVKTYEAYSDFPVVGNIIGDIAVLSTTPIKNYYVSTSVPKSPQEGTVWIVQDNTSNYYVTSDWNRIGISYVMQYENSKWVLKKSYVYNGESWTMLYYVNLKNGYVDLTKSDINAQIEYNYDYTGEYQTFKAVFSGYYKVELWGAQGGTYSNGVGGKGAYASGEIYLNAGETIYIYVGQQPTSATGGWNGGGNGNDGGYVGRGGGGATDIRLVSTIEKNIWNEFESLKSRIMVAAGGGGGGYCKDNGNVALGGAGGDIKGVDGSGTSVGAKGAMQSLAGYYTFTSFVGGFGYGSASSTSHHTVSGGGGGYYGGGGGGNYYAGGSGGSSYVSGYNGCSSVEEQSTSTNIMHNGSALHYSGKYFLNSDIKNGKDNNVPSHDKKTVMTGNNGNGYAKITLITVEIKSDEEIESIKSENNNKWNYSFSGVNGLNGRYQYFVAPESGYYQIELWGAQGGTYSNGKGGKGAYTSGNIYLQKNKILYVYIGGTTDNSTGGWNGGANGRDGGYIGQGGGGATDIRLTATTSLSLWNEFESVKSRIMVAAGGGGGGYCKDNGNVALGGYGGDLSGGDGSGSGGTTKGAGQSLGGYYTSTAFVGTFGYGSSSSTSHHTVGGGGGGYYGGGGGGSYYIGGSGGSSYISGYEGCNSTSESSSFDQILHNGSAYHYSGYYFSNGVILSGNSTSVPSYSSGALETGNSGSGYARITLKSKEEKTSSELEAEREKLLTKWNYQYSGTTGISGRYQEFIAPVTGTYKIELWGAQGGTYSNGKGGNGSYTSGTISLSKKDKLYLYIGSTTTLSTGSWNGGANGNDGGYIGRGGGGATDVRTVPTISLSIWNDIDSLKSRIMVAAGGGGGGYCSANSNVALGGAGGGLTGVNGSGSGGTGGTGGTQIAGGYYTTTTYNGSFGFGSIANTSRHTVGGGGGGWYGGGGAGTYYQGGGGGSSYISGHAGCIGVNSSGNPLASTYSKLADSISYTGYKFTNTQMIDGQGYPWTTVKSSASSGMPSPTSSSLITGNTGSGYAKITYLGT